MRGEIAEHDERGKGLDEKVSKVESIALNVALWSE